MPDTKITQLGDNIKARIEGNKLILEIDHTRRGGLSKSGKTTIVATSRGNQEIAGIKIGVNAYVK